MKISDLSDLELLERTDELERLGDLRTKQDDKLLIIYRIELKKRGLLI